MEWLLPAVVATFLGSLVLTFVYTYLYTLNRERHVGIWAVSWAVYSLRFVCQLWLLYLDSDVAALQFGTQMAAMISGVLLLWGTHVFLEREFSHWWGIVATLDALWIVVTLFSDAAFEVQTLPTYMFLGIVYIWTGVILWRHRPLDDLSPRFVGAVFVLWGIHKMNFPVLSQVMWFAPWGYLFAATLELLAAIGIILIYFQRIYRELEKSEEKFRNIVAQSNDGIVIVDQNGAIVAWNHGQEAITGIRQAEALNRPIWEVQAELSMPENCPSEDAPASETATEQQLKDKTHSALRGADMSWVQSSGEMQIRRADGETRCIQVSMFPIQTESGMIAASITRDITAMKQAEAQLHRRRNELETLLEIGRELSSTLDLDEVLSLIVDRLGLLLETDECAIFRLDKDQRLRPVLANGPYRDQILDVELEIGQGLTGKCVEQRVPILCNFAQQDPRSYHIPCTPNDEYEHTMVTPLISQGSVVGAMLIRRMRARLFTDADMNLLLAISQPAAAALHNASLHQELELYSAGLEKAVEQRALELRKTMGRIEVILDNSPDAVLLLAANGTIETANRAFSEHFDYTLDEVSGQTPIMLADPSSADHFSQALRTVLDTGKTVRLEITAWRVSGETFDADAALAPVKEDGVMTGIVCSFRDISAFKEVQRMKDAFVSNVSHELRTPITSIKLYHDLLIRRPENYRTYMPRLERETERLASIIEDLLLLSRLDQRRITMRPKSIDVSLLAGQYVTDRALLAQERNLEMRFQSKADMPYVHADPGMIGTVLSVLLTNAINYTPGGGKINVTVGETVQSNSRWAQIHVADTGPGISPDEQKSLFDRFSRGVAGLQSGAPGTGLGLAIAKEIVEYHQGKITVVSEGIPGKGTTFTVWLPIRTP